MVEFEQKGDELHCIFSGRMDGPTCQKVEGPVMEKMNGSPAFVVFDLKDVDYISSVFFRLCIQSAKQLDPGAFSVINTQPDVKNVFRISGLSQMLNVR